MQNKKDAPKILQLEAASVQRSGEQIQLLLLLGTRRRFQICRDGSSGWTRSYHIVFRLRPAWPISVGWLGIMMRPPPSGEVGALDPDTSKKRKSRAAAVHPTTKKTRSLKHRAAAGTTASTSEANPDTEGEDDEEFPLERRTRSSARASQEPQTEAAESGTVGSRRPFSSGELRDAQGMISAKAGIPLQGGSSIANIFDGVSDSADLDIPGAFKACKEIYDHAILRLRKKLSYHEKECKEVTSKLWDSEARPARGGKELGELRTTLETMLREKANLAAQINQLNAEISGLREQNEIAAGELTTSRDLLKDARREVAALAAVKSEVERNAITYQEDAATTYRIARDISIEAGQKLTQAIKHAKAEAKTETLEEIGARGIDLSADLKEAREAEEELALLVAPDEILALCASSSTSLFSENFAQILISPPPPTHWSPSEVPNLAEWSRKLAAFSIYDRRRWRDLSKGRWEAFDRLKYELLRCKAPLREALDREKSLKLLCATKESELVSLRRELNNKADELGQLWGEVGRVKREFIELQAHASAHFAAEKRAQAGVSAIEAQIQTVRVNDFAWAKMIARLSSEISKEKIEVVNA
ncbi:uncharacterized protein [Nicotiana sylvestris]|uniref:uncharacterized protein n=1 Tax=Nicotiana sylvestris TaxID=4096 RepID=UPI00388CB533